MITAVVFVTLAAAGAVVRAEAGRRWNRDGGMPWGTLAVNVAGSFLLGLLWDVAPPALTLLGVAGLGTFTTFSSFARELVMLTERRRLLTAAAYLAASCGGGIAAATLAVALAS